MYIARNTRAGRSARSSSPRLGRLTIEHAAIIDRASEPYRGAGAFAYNFARGKLRGDPVFRALLERGLLLGRSRILDLGCGTFSPNELDPFIAYHGIDCSGEAIRIARRKFPHYSYKIENFRVANITANADLVMMLDVIGTQADPWEGPLLMRVLTWANRAVLISARAPGHDTSEQAWEVFLTRVESVLPGFRKVGHVGTEIFLLKTL